MSAVLTREQQRKIEEEVRAGLPNERSAIAEAIELAAYLRGEGHTYIHARPAEDPRDFAERPKRTVELLRRVVDLLAQQYAQPPARKFAAAAQAYLDEVYEAAHLNAKLGEADRLCTSADLALLQAWPDGQGGIGLHVWAREEFAYWTAPGDPTTIVAICTIDREDERSRFTLWTDELEIVYLTEKLLPGQTAGGRVPREVRRAPHGLGRLPFVAIGYELPTRSWDLVRGPGHVVKRTNAAINEELSDLANAVRHYGMPMVVATGLASGQRLTNRPGSVNILATSANAAGQGMPPEIKHLQADLDIDGLWNSVRSSIGQCLQDVGIPPSAYRLEATEVASGISLLVEQAPLLKRLEARRPLWARYEQEIAALCLGVAGSYYGRADLLALAEDPAVDLWWPEPRIPIPDATLVQIEASDLAEGLISKTMILMRRHGWTREQARDHLTQVAEDREFEQGVLAPTDATLNMGANPDGLPVQQGQGEDQQGQQQQQGQAAQAAQGQQRQGQVTATTNPPRRRT